MADLVFDTICGPIPQFVYQLKYFPTFVVTAVCVLFAVPPDIIDEESSSDTLATEGMPVALVCKARGNPRTQIAWRREDGKPIRLCQPERPIDRPRKRQHHSRDRECREG